MTYKFCTSPQRFMGCSPLAGFSETNTTSQNICTDVGTVSKEVMMTRFLQREANSRLLQETEIRDL